MRSSAKVLAAALPLLLTACATIAPPQPPSLELPKPPTDLRASRKGDHVFLSWTVPGATTDRQVVRTVGLTEICRTLSPELAECGTPVGNAPATSIPASDRSSKKRPSETYTDTVPAQLLGDDPSAFVTYAVEVLNRAGRGAGVSNRIHVPLIRTLPPPSDFKAQVTGEGVVLSWVGENPSSATGVRDVYRVYRRREDQPQATMVGQIEADGRHSFTLTDSDIEWEKTYEYRAEAVTLLHQPKQQELQVEGPDTTEVKVFADDVFPPAVPSGLQAVDSGPGQQRFVDLIWAPVPDLDLAGYNVYRRTEETAARRINPELVQAPAYRDPQVEPGKKYFYTVTSVDLRGNESAPSEGTSERVPQ